MTSLSLCNLSDKPRCRTVLLSGLAWIASSALYAGPVTYQGSYNPAGNPNHRHPPDRIAHGEAGSDGLWQQDPVTESSNASLTAPEPVIEEIEGFWALSTDTSADPSFITTWTLGHDWVNGAIQGTPEEESTVDITLCVQKGEFYLRIGGRTGFNYVIFRPDRIIVTGAEGNSVANVNIATFQTFRIVRRGGRATVYQAGNETPLISDWEQVANTRFNNLLFGDASSTSSGIWNLANISWTNAEAEFSTPEMLTPSP